VSNVEITPLKIRVGKRFTITIPKEVREKLNIKEGDELELTVIGNNIVIKKAMSLAEFIDSVKPKGSIKIFLKERRCEVSVEEERYEELAEKHSH